MSRLVSWLCVAVLLLDEVAGKLVEDVSETDQPYDSPDQDISEQEFSYIINPDVEKALVTLENLAVEADKMTRFEDTPIADVNKMFGEMTDLLDNMIEAVKNSNNAYKFLKAKGLDRIVPQNLKAENAAVKARILMLLKVLFDVAPTTTGAVIPITIVDRLLDVFERDNLGLKAHALDVLYLWLPNNPRVQARVMKIKGLAPFYEQVGKLDTSVIKTLLDLFNTILKEHVSARNDVQRSTVDSDKMKFYMRIGLLEHMATPMVCNGLLNIFSKTWPYNTADNNIIVTVFDMIKNIKQFCLKVYRGKPKAKKLFTALQDYVKEPQNLNYFESTGLNITDISLVLEDYVEKLRHSIKDEM
ncbi:unnamed protein product [Chrysodeixis includens]|uniref:Uncharacterized protein n=1 Tax=Chrysodeixis includens TaxID=689277 RepID=A0A9P0BQ39_CHRIL|nr:unnamed protein product [Chrysodeixis includens]